MDRSNASGSDSSGDEEYIPPDCVEESSENSEDEVSDDEVEQGLNARKSSKPIEGKDRDEIWTDFLKGTKSLNQSMRRSSRESQELQSNSHSTSSSLPAMSSRGIESNSYNSSKEKFVGLGIKRAAPTSSNRLTDAIKRLKSSTLSTGVPKISVLEKSRLDWESFTEREGIKDDLKLHNKGKNGYVERKAFEARTQEREYQILKEARLKSIQRR